MTVEAVITTAAPSRGAAPRTVHQAVLDVMHTIGTVGIGKSGWNDHSSYSYRSIEDVLAAFNRALVQHQLVIIPVAGERVSEQRGRQNYVAVRVEYTLVGPDGSTFTAAYWGEGGDVADKATMKAETAALKYMLTALFHIPVDGLADGDSDTPDRHKAEHEARMMERGRQEMADGGAQRGRQQPRGQRPDRGGQRQGQRPQQGRQPSGQQPSGRSQAARQLKDAAHALGWSREQLVDQYTRTYGHNPNDATEHQLRTALAALNAPSRQQLPAAGRAQAPARPQPERRDPSKLVHPEHAHPGADPAASKYGDRTPLPYESCNDCGSCPDCLGDDPSAWGWSKPWPPGSD